MDFTNLCSSRHVDRLVLTSKTAKEDHSFRDHSFSTYAKFSEKLIFLTPLIGTRAYSYQGVRNVSFLDNFA